MMTDATHMMHAAQADALLSPGRATHVAVRDGAWSDPGTWAGGRVPGAEARVHVPDGIDVTYDVGRAVPLDTVRVDGALRWATNQSTEMLVETIVTTHGSVLEVGTMHGAPIAANVTAEITFRDTPINTATDPGQLGNGLVAFGHVDIRGAEKESFLTMKQGVSAGARQVSVEGDLTNWKVGDTILLVGTSYAGEQNGRLQTQDEERTIVAINGDTIVFDRPLDHSHRPPAGHDFDTYVGNISRNVVFSSEDPGGTRGHVMLHNGMVDHGAFANSVMFAEFRDLGRTDSSRSSGTADNPAGRYPLHLHEIGTEPDSAASMLQGNAVSGGPGWGIVHHSSHAMINDNIVHDFVGAGIISEDGDETGMWMRNLVTGVSGAPGVDIGAFGREGAAYENQSRVVFQQDNIAANARIGWNFTGRENFPEDANNAEDQAPHDGIHRKMFERAQVPFDPSPFDVALDHEEPPLIDFDGNQVIASDVGLRVFHRQFSDDTDTMSVLRNFDVWGGRTAVELKNYASNYQFMDSVWQGSSLGFHIERKTSSVVFNNVEMHDFGTGYRSFGINHEVVLIDTDFINVRNHFDLEDLMRNVDSSSVRNDLIRYFRENHGIDYTNPMPRIMDSDDLNPVSRITFRPDPGSDMTIGPNDPYLEFTGTITDSVGTRNFNEYAIAKTPSGSFSSKDFEGIDLMLGAVASGRQVEFFREEFMELHGTYRHSNGQWVVPVVNWITDRGTGDQHPVVIEIRLEGFSQDILQRHELDAYPNPGINNPGWYQANDPFGTGTPPAPAPDHGGMHGPAPVQPEPEPEPVVQPEPVVVQPEPVVVQPEPEPEPEPEPVVVQPEPVIAPPAPVTVAPTPTPDRDPLPPEAGRTEIRGSSRSETLADGNGDTVLVGLDGRDTLDGGAGDDILDGGARRDNLTGGPGADIFRYAPDSLDQYRDDITDFSIEDGDRIDLSPIADAYGLDEAQMRDVLTFTDLAVGLRATISFNDGSYYNFALIQGPDAETFIEADPLILTPAQKQQPEEREAPQPVSSNEATQDDTQETTDTALEASPPEETPEVETPPASGSLETAGAPLLAGTDGADTLKSSHGANTIIGNGGDDRLLGNGGGDLIFGGAGEDLLRGDDGMDVLAGGGQRDTLKGGSGADRFVFTAEDLDGSTDRLEDFNRSEGDVIDLSDLAERFSWSVPEVGFVEHNKGMYLTVATPDGDYTLADLRDLGPDDISAADIQLL